MTHQREAINDYTEIRSLSARLNRLADLGDGDTSSNLYTEDAGIHYRRRWQIRRP